jgi:hypothetical protein
LEVDATIWPSGQMSNAGSDFGISNGHASENSGDPSGKSETAKWKNFISSADDETPFFFSKPPFKADGVSPVISEPAENIFGVSIVASATPFVLSEPSFKADGVSFISSEPVEKNFGDSIVSEEISFAFPEPASAPENVQSKTKAVSWSRENETNGISRPSKVGNQVPHTHAEGFGDFNKGINTCGFFAAFKLPNIIMMQVRLFRQFFLTHPHILSTGSNDFAKNFSRFLLCGHSFRRKQEERKSSTVLRLYFSLDIFVLKPRMALPLEVTG